MILTHDSTRLINMAASLGASESLSEILAIESSRVTYNILLDLTSSEAFSQVLELLWFSKKFCPAVDHL